MNEPVRQHYEYATTGKIAGMGSAPAKPTNPDNAKSAEKSQSEKPQKNA
jgi:hypothetical protein